jgi:hypothetical protein
LLLIIAMMLLMYSLVIKSAGYAMSAGLFAIGAAIYHVCTKIGKDDHNG